MSRLKKQLESNTASTFNLLQYVICAKAYEIGWPDGSAC